MQDVLDRVIAPARRFGLTLAIAAIVLTTAAPAAAQSGGASTTAATNATTTAATTTFDTGLPPLRDIAPRRFFIGSAIGLPQLDTDATYRALAGQEFNAVTPENAMKWDTTEPQPGVFNFGPGDEIVAFARANNQVVHGHVLVWHNQLPSWVTSGSFTPDQLRQILHDHIVGEVSHFRGQIYAWDVVNEAFNDDGTYRQTIWYNALGPSYIADAFRWAHQADPKARLYYNDYNIEGIGPKSDAVYNMVRSLQAQGVPITGVGIQGHLDIQYGFPYQMPQNIKRFTDLGLQAWITELDVRVFTPATADELAKQASYYSQVVSACLTDVRCVGVTVWGFTDKYSWVPSVFAGEGAADIYDENFTPKPAYFATAAQLALGYRPLDGH